jgi:hypothetical protein
MKSIAWAIIVASFHMMPVPASLPGEKVIAVMAAFYLISVAGFFLSLLP